LDSLHASARVSAVSKEVMAARSRLADGNRDMVTENPSRRRWQRPAEGGESGCGERVDEAVSSRWKCPVDVIHIVPRRCRHRSRSPRNDFERLTATDQMWKTFRTAAAGYNPPHFGLAESRVLA